MNTTELVILLFSSGFAGALAGGGVSLVGLWLIENGKKKMILSL